MRQLVVISNRLPVVIEQHEDRFSIREGAGGLVTALKPLLTERGGAWIGFCGMFDTDRGAGWEQTLADFGGKAIQYVPVTPERSVYEGYYRQYANQELWPRFHELTDKMSHEAADSWDDYVRMNRLFAEQTLPLAGKESLIWIQDYHLLLLPQMLREQLPETPIGHFLHIPFPSAEVMADQPHARPLMEGLLGADVLGFHIPAYLQNFLDVAERTTSASVLSHNETEAVLEYQGRRVHLGVFPIGVDAEALPQVADVNAVQGKLAGLAETLILSMDRLDYTKAIPPRLFAYRQLLEQYPQYQQAVSLVQLLDMSRKDIPAYEEEYQKVEQAVCAIQEQFPSWTALHIAVERWRRHEVAGLMQLSRVCLVTPRCDGMNLVSKEYVSAAPDDGVLVLSRQTGAAWQLAEHAVMVDGNSPESIREGLRTALEMPAEERRTRMAGLKEIVRREDVFWWSDRFLEMLAAAAN